ncbi:hypothetical protein [Neorhizobium vignae]|nr:hypothetical protein [Neorhizobium vignae]
MKAYLLCEDFKIEIRMALTYAEQGIDIRRDESVTTLISGSVSMPS